jgi:hypothetical protein
VLAVLYPFEIRKHLPAGSYRLDDRAALFFGARRLRLIQRAEGVAGRFGRSGTLKGKLSALTLTGLWIERDRSGWLRVTFDGLYQSFEGTYGLGSDETSGIGQFSGHRTGSGL